MCIIDVCEYFVGVVRNMERGSANTTNATNISSATEFVETVDVVIVGSGGGGMVAALVANDLGLSARIIEKTATYGGSTARSGGGIWIPCNYLMREAGVADTPEEARTYLQATVGDRSPQASRDAYVRNAAPMIDWLRANTAVDFTYMPGYADYYPELPGGKAAGRAIEADLFDGRRLGDDLVQLRAPYIEMPGGLAFRAREFQKLAMVMRTWRGKATAARIGARVLMNRVGGRKMLMMGQSLIGAMRLSLKERKVPLSLNTPLTELIVEDGRVVGVRAERNGQPIELRARKAVILAAGGFEHNLEMRLQYQQHPIGTEWTVGAEGNTGDAIQAGMRLGADIDLMNEAWWGPTSLPPDRSPAFHVGERAHPGIIMVGKNGKRFTNESASYVQVVQHMYRAHRDDDPHVPCYFIFDQRYRDNYLFGQLAPKQPVPGKFFKSGYMKRADTIVGLAEQLGIPPAALAATVQRFNAFAREGKDRDFGRGESAYDHYYGDPTNKPNPNLAPLEKAPFYGVACWPGDLGTKGGLKTDEFARVLRPDGQIIEGLYCVGNNAASVMGATYPGPGCTIGSTMTFGYIAARHIAGATT